jgi:hypothetical protein
MRRLWLWLSRRRKPAGNGDARHARLEAERKLAAAQRMWPKTRETHDRLAELIEQALRGNR